MNTFLLTSATTEAQLNQFISDYLNSKNLYSSTNYEDPLLKAETWFNSVEANGHDNRLYFITDRGPNKSNSGGRDMSAMRKRSITASSETAPTRSTFTP